MTLDPTFREFAAALNVRSARYLVVGGYAVAFHGHPRYTKDLDVWLDPEPRNVAAMLLALEDFGFASLRLTPEDFSDPEFLIQLGRPPLRIDLMTDGRASRSRMRTAPASPWTRRASRSRSSTSCGSSRASAPRGVRRTPRTCASSPAAASL